MGRWRSLGQSVESAQFIRRIVAEVFIQHDRIGPEHFSHRLPFALVDAVLDKRARVAHEDIRIDPEGRIGAAPQHLRRMQGELEVFGLAGHEPAQVKCALMRGEHRVSIRRAVAHGRRRNARGIFRAGPERATGRADVVLVQWLDAVPPGGCVMEKMLLNVGVPAEHQHIREWPQQREQAIPVGMAKGFHAGRVEQGNVQRDHQQALPGYAGQVGGQECELLLAQSADIDRRALPGRYTTSSSTTNPACSSSQANVSGPKAWRKLSSECASLSASKSRS